MMASGLREKGGQMSSGGSKTLNADTIAEREFVITVHQNEIHWHHFTRNFFCWATRISTGHCLFFLLRRDFRKILLIMRYRIAESVFSD
jgi:hypothetical protein